MPLSPPQDSLIDDLVLANKILHRYGIVDGYGHVSARLDSNAGNFLLSRSKAPALIERTDIRVHDFSGAMHGDGAPYLERFIHSEIYKARPDVHSIVHSHSQGSIIFGVTGRRLRPIYHMSGFLGSGSPIFDIGDVMGDSDLLVSSPELGGALATTLAGQSCALMRGHGMTVVGASIQEAVFRAVYTEKNAQMQLQAGRDGDIKYLSPGEAELTAALMARSIDRTWQLWVKEAEHDRHGS
jgi:ribulose-5-phosphate 4-epimerase/fuculose-1-phosphate aldolase